MDESTICESAACESIRRSQCIGDFLSGHIVIYGNIFPEIPRPVGILSFPRQSSKTSQPMVNIVPVTCVSTKVTMRSRVRLRLLLSGFLSHAATSKAGTDSRESEGKFGRRVHQQPCVVCYQISSVGAPGIQAPTTELVQSSHYLTLEAIFCKDP